MKIHVGILSVLFVFAGVQCAFAAGEGEQPIGSMGAMMENKSDAASSAVAVGNKICPVSGEDVGDMGSPVQYEYNGKIYNFCCTACVAEFKKDPEKYARIAEQQMAAPMAEKKDDGRHKPDRPAESMMSVQNPVKEINLEAYQFAFSPDTITVKKGDTVKIHATSRDVPHGIFIKEYGINQTVEKGNPTDIEFVADKAGTFDILCSVYCGRGHQNMKAKLIVTE